MTDVQSLRKKILIVDDDKDVLKIIRQCLKLNKEYISKTASSGEKAMKLVSLWCPQLVLLDINIPDVNGLQILKAVKARAKSKYVPVIFLSSQSDVKDIIHGLDSGADDYICKPFDIQELLARIRNQFRIKELREQLQAANRKLKKLAHTDDLTGLMNMRSLYDKLNYEMNRARRFKRSIFVLMLDMDYFKSVNDQNDHLFGSYVLSEVGSILKENVREIDLAARYGGDEFLLILTDVNLKGALALAERIRQVIEGRSFSYKNFHQELTVSIGLSEFRHSDTDLNARKLVRLADHALYEAKKTGRNCVRLHKMKSPSKKKKNRKGA